MDASKSPATMDHMAQEFFPHLIPGRSIVIQQDYLHWRQPWVTVQMQLLKRHFRPLVHIPEENVVWVCKKEISTKDIERNLVNPLSNADMIPIVEQAMERFGKRFGHHHFERMISGLRRNPDIRIAWNMVPEAKG